MSSTRIHLHPLLAYLPISCVIICIVAPTILIASGRKDNHDFPERTLILGGQYIHNIGKLQMNVTNWGFLGSLPKSKYPMSESPSAQWPVGSGVEYMYAAGIWVGAIMNGIPSVSTGYPETEFYPGNTSIDVIYRTFDGDRNGIRYPGAADDDQDGMVDEDWLNGRDDDGDGRIDEDFAAISQQMFSCWYIDNQAVSSTVYPEHIPLNVRVRQETYQWGDDNFDDFVGASYYVTNLGNEFLTGVYIGIYADLDAGPRVFGSYHLDDRIEFWEGAGCGLRGEAEVPVRLKIGYVFDADGDRGKTPGYFGIVLLGHTTDLFTPSSTIYLRAVRIFRGLQSYAHGGEPTNDFERYDALSTRRVDRDMGQPNDYKILLSIGPFGFLPPGGTIVLDAAFVCGEGLEEMLQNAANAVIVHEGFWFDKDNDPSTGVYGRETPIPGPLTGWDPNRCDNVMQRIKIDKGEVVWSNIDCADELWRWNSRECSSENLSYEYILTGIGGRETQIPWITDLAPPPPNMRIVSGDHMVTLFWDNRSEIVPDIISHTYDFEGYQVWRADGWHRPIGSTVISGPSSDLWQLVESRDILNGVPPDRDFKRPFSLGGWEYEPLASLQDREQLLKAFEESIWYNQLDTVPCPPGLSREDCDTLEALARYNLGFEGGRQYYMFVDKNVHNGMPYFYSVVPYDHKTRYGEPTQPGRYNNPALNFEFVTPRSDAQSLDEFKRQEVYVVPNPVSNKSLEPWRMEPNNSDPSGLKLEFRNLPQCVNTIRIYTIAGDLVQTLNHDGRDGNGTQPWNLLTRNGQDVTSGVYLFSVDPTDSRFPRIVGKFVVIR